jgi:hypothetical protein
MARDFERQERFHEALELFKLTELAPARERRVRILHRIGETAEALQLCHEIMLAPADDAEMDFTQRFLPKLDSAFPKPPRFLPEVETQTLHNDGRGVEMAVARYFEEQGWEAHYLENMLFLGLYGLAFWDIIFASVPGAFFNHYQAAPADLNTGDFFIRRKALIKARLNRVRDGNLTPEWLRAIYLEKEGVNNLLVSWRHLDVKILTTALNCIPAEHLAGIFERLSFDLRGNRSGFPDLILFKPAEKRYQLIEVKGPGDRLQPNQRRWFNVFHNHQIPATLVNVSWE